MGAEGVVGGVRAPFELAVGDGGPVAVDEALQGVAAFAVGGAGVDFDRRFGQRGVEGLDRGFGAAFVADDQRDFVLGAGFEAFGVAGHGLGAFFALDGAADRVAVGVFALGAALKAPFGLEGFLADLR